MAECATGEGIEKFLRKICSCCNNVLILWLKGMRSGGIELPPCLSRYLHRVPSSVYNIQPHPGGCYSEARKGVVVVFFKCNICKFEIYNDKLNYTNHETENNSAGSAHGSADAGGNHRLRPTTSKSMASTITKMVMAQYRLLIKVFRFLNTTVNTPEKL